MQEERREMLDFEPRHETIILEVLTTEVLRLFRVPAELINRA